MPVKHERPTPSDLTADDIFSWPLMIAMLGRADPEMPQALKVGVIALAWECLEQLQDPRASPDLVVRLRQYADVLAHLVKLRDDG